MRAWSEQGLARTLAGVEIALSILVFALSASYARATRAPR